MFYLSQSLLSALILSIFARCVIAVRYLAMSHENTDFVGDSPYSLKERP